MRIGARAFAAAVTAAAGLALGGPAVAHADPPNVQNGETQPAYSYQDAIRERVFVPVAGVDQDNDGVTDRVAVDIIRPKESGPSLKVPAIIDDSPYYTSVGRGNETQFIHTTADGVLDKFPLYYDNFFVPRGYAFVAAEADGTGFSTGCPLHGGPGDVAGFKAVIDWLMGRVDAYTTRTGDTTVHNDWDSGKNAMIGKSYDGTFANGVASTGVDGLTTIVPISAISDWYDYSRMGGIRFNTNYPASLSNSITRDQPASVLGVTPPTGAQSRNSICAPTRDAMSAIDGDEDGDINQFWQDRNYNLNVDKVKAAVFESHGLDDDNVLPDHMSQWWAGLTANNVPRKLWLSQEGHVDPFDYRRDAWVDTLHRWFDYWLLGVQNGIMQEPMVDIEQPQGDVWKTYASWPIPGTVDADVYLSGRSAGTSGSLGLSSGGSTDSLTFTDPPAPSRGTTENTEYLDSPNGSQASRLVFLTTKLKQDLHISGTPQIDIRASLSTPQSNLGAILVDYGPFDRVGRGGSDGVTTTTTRDCWGPNSTDAQGNVLDSACYLEVTKPHTTGTAWRVSHGILDSSNRDSLFTGQASPVTVGQSYEFKFPTLPTDYTFPAGHQVGVVIVANDDARGGLGIAGTRGATITVDTRNSKIVLPVTGGAQAAADSGGFVADTTAPVLADHPNVTILSSDPSGAILTYTNPTATDTQDPNPTVTCTPASGTRVPISTFTVTCTATDANGNTSAPKSFVAAVDFAAQGGVSGTVPATLGLSLGAPASFGPFTPGSDQDYSTTTTATVTSTAGDATLSVSDPDTANPGHLVNGASCGADETSPVAQPGACGSKGAFVMAQPLQAQASSQAAGNGSPFAPISASPLALLSWTGPVSNDQVTVSLKQHVGRTDPLRTGSYSKTLTFTLSTTTP